MTTKNSQPGRVSVDLGELRPKVEDICRRRGVPISDFVRDAINLHLEAELKREPQWRERALLYVFQAVDNLLRRTPDTVLSREMMMKVLTPLRDAENALALGVYGRLGPIGHGGSLERTSRYPDPNLFPWEWPALEILIDTISDAEPFYLPMTGSSKGMPPRTQTKDITEDSSRSRNVLKKSRKAGSRQRTGKVSTE